MRAPIVIWSAALVTMVLLVGALTSQRATASPVAVTVNDRQLNVTAFTSGNRTMVPMRAIFEALGSTLLYDARRRLVRASTGGHILALPIGEHLARVDGAVVRIDVPARIVADRTYVPLRFVAQALGATVGYDRGAHLVGVYTRGGYGAATASARVPDPSVKAPPLVPVVVQQNPVPNSRVFRSYPIISARIVRRSGAAVDSGAVHLYLDGSDVTSYASFNGDTLTYVPQQHFNQGWHDVFLEGVDANGQSFSSSWNFDSVFSYDEGFTTSDSGFNFYPSGGTVYYPGDWMHFVLLAPPGGSAYLNLCGLGRYPFVRSGFSPYYYVTMPAPPGLVITNCNLGAYYTGSGGLVTLVPASQPISVLTGANYVTPTLPAGAHPGPIYRYTRPVYRIPAVGPRALPITPMHTVATPQAIVPSHVIVAPRVLNKPRATASPRHIDAPSLKSTQAIRSTVPARATPSP